MNFMYELMYEGHKIDEMRALSNIITMKALFLEYVLVKESCYTDY